jgi:phenylalanyl-tRNA synthetase alpha chain
MDLREMLKKSDDIFNQAKDEIGKISGKDSFEQWKIKYLGRKGKVKQLFSLISELPDEVKGQAGKKLNELKERLQNFAVEKHKGVELKEKENINLSFPGKTPRFSNLHPLTVVTREMTDIFSKMGFGVYTGPEIESDYYNFQALNTPDDHPAKDMWDTFYLSEKNKVLLRTHTSPVQVRFSEKNSPPFRMVAIGRCFRRDAFDASHSPVFHQMEGLMVQEGIKFSHLKGILTYFLNEIFGQHVKVKFTPSYFPFTEPSAEVNISCMMCGGKGCSTCANTGWIEILGCGMVHPNVFRYVGYDTSRYTGFAFGIGIERIAMIKFGIKDIRYFYQNDIRFIKQFG